MPGDDRTEELRLLRDIARWTRESALPTLRPRVQALLDSDSKRRAYALMDGQMTIKAIEAGSGANHSDIAKWLRSWMPEGIVDAEASPPRATFKLAELGIETPPPKATRAVPKKA